MPEPTILVVDDTPELLTITSTVLEGAGYGVVCARDGVEALTVLEKDRTIELLLTDIVMPGELHGFELARRAKAVRPHVKVAYVTGYSDLIPDRMGEVFGPILQKPYRAPDLLRQVRSLLDAADDDGDRPVDFREASMLGRNE